MFAMILLAHRRQDSFWFHLISAGHCKPRLVVFLLHKVYIYRLHIKMKYFLKYLALLSLYIFGNGCCFELIRCRFVPSMSLDRRCVPTLKGRFCVLPKRTTRSARSLETV
ncbi:hypothetical protein VPH35_097842 [Triticum aestivum]|uniref:Uncharacterized protein n=1 Tax=Aegilops tauschii subsp. strangulata TaxID=200361 RepID=A0A453KVJ4_AEGTS